MLTLRLVLRKQQHHFLLSWTLIHPQIQIGGPKRGEEGKEEGDEIITIRHQGRGVEVYLVEGHRATTPQLNAKQNILSHLVSINISKIPNSLIDIIQYYTLNADLHQR